MLSSKGFSEQIKFLKQSVKQCIQVLLIWQQHLKFYEIIWVTVWSNKSWWDLSQVAGKGSWGHHTEHSPEAEDIAWWVKNAHEKQLALKRSTLKVLKQSKSKGKIGSSSPSTGKSEKGEKSPPIIVISLILQPLMSNSPIERIKHESLLYLNIRRD